MTANAVWTKAPTNAVGRIPFDPVVVPHWSGAGVIVLLHGQPKR